MFNRYVYSTALLLFSLEAAASGSLGGSYGGSSPAPRPTDPLYEAGKAIAKGKDPSYRGIETCMKVDGIEGVTKPRAKYMRAHRRGTVSDLINQLYDCDEPERKIASVMASDDLKRLVYYMNKRYKLKLK